MPSYFKNKPMVFNQPSADTEPPAIYMPRMQLAIRMTLGLLAAFYFFVIPVTPFLLRPVEVGGVIAAFFIFHIAWWWHYRTRRAGWMGVRLAAWVDIGAAFTATLIDPFDVPPTGMLVMIAVMGNGMQHGLRIFLEQFVAVLLLGIPVLAVRQWLFFSQFSFPLVFVVLFIAIFLYYNYLLISRIERMKKEAQIMARQDPLTGLYNRAAFIQSAGFLLSLHERQKTPLVLIFADLDNFKGVNDTKGHLFGDEVLKYFSRLTWELLRKTDIVARYGGDEFVFMLVDMTVDDAARVTDRLRSRFIEWAGKQGAEVGVSFGIAAVPDAPVAIDRLLKHVDKALYEAKKHKGKQWMVIAPPLA